MELIVRETLTRSSGIPLNASSMSARVSMAIPTRPTSPSARGSLESRPHWVGRSKATLSASWPWAIRYLKRALVSTGVPKPTYWRMVQTPDVLGAIDRLHRDAGVERDVLLLRLFGHALYLLHLRRAPRAVRVPTE